MKKKLGAILLVVGLAVSLGLVPAVSVNANGALPTVTWLPPLTNQTDFQLKDGSTLPIKFILTDPGTGAFVEDTSARVDVNKVIFWDNFDSEIGVTPSQWEFRSPDSTTVSIDDTVYFGASGKSAKLMDSSATARPDMYKEIDSQTGTFWYEAAVRCAQNNQVDTFLYISEGEGMPERTGGSIGNNAVTVAFWNDGYIKYNDEGTWKNVQTYQANKWYTAKVFVDVPNQKYNLYIDGVLKVTGVNFRYTLFSLDRIYATTTVATPSSTIWIDNVLVMQAPPAKTFNYGTGDDNLRISYDAVFADNFDDGNSDGWSPVAGDTSWSVVGGKLYTNGSLAQARIFADSTMSYRDYSFEADARLISGRGYALNFRAADSEQFYAFQYQAGTGALSLRLYQFTDFPDGADVAPLVPYSTNNDWHHLKVVVIGNHIECYVDGDMVFDVSDTVAPAPLQGGIGFRTWSNSQAEFDNVVVQVPQYIANLHTTELTSGEGDYLITVWSGTNELSPSYLVDLTASVQGVGRGKGKA